MGSNQKTRTKLKRALACFMTVLMVLTAVPLGGFAGVDLSKVFDISMLKASAADTKYTEGYYTYTVSNGEATITDCDTSISGDVTIPSILGGYPVTSIGDDAFYFCKAITSITIPDSVTNIGECAFSVCSAMKSLTIGRNVTSIGENAFDYCTGLTKINWNAENVDDLTNGGAFYNAGADGDGIDVVFGNNVKKIPDYAFYGLYNGDYISAKIKSVTMGNNITSIGSHSFENCDNLTSITIPNSVTNIGEYAFAKCTDLTSVTIPDSVTTIDAGAFAYCPKLTSVAIPDGVTIISWCLFDGCSSLTDVTIPDGITSIGGSAFYGCSSLKSITIPEGITSIEEFTFQDCSSLTSITIPDSVTSIEWNAFAGCTGLTSITIPEDVTSMGNNAFGGCNGLTEIIWNATNVKFDTSNINVGVFYNAGIDTDGIDVIFGDNVEAIPSHAFYGYSPYYEAVSANLKSVTFGDSLTSIGDHAFTGCSGLTSITLPDSVTSIGSQAFYNCTGLTRVNISDLASWCKISFDDNASNPLCYAEKLYINGNLATNIVIPDSVTSIGDWAFYGYKGLTSITIPDSVTSIGNSAFSGCTNLQYAESKGGLETVGNYVFNGCSNLAYLIVPNSVTTLGNYAINGCDNLKDVYYSGTEEEFNEISFGEGYADRTDITVHFNFNGCIHSNTTEYEQQDATCTEDGFTAGVYCEDCGEWISGHEVITAHHTDEDDNGYCDSCGENICEHASISTVNAKEATCTEAGYTGDKVCDKCGEVIEAGTEIPAREHIDEDNDGICDVCGEDITRTVISSGNCGETIWDDNENVIGFSDNVTYKLYSDGELVISGNGRMGYFDFFEDYGKKPPYSNYTYNYEAYYDEMLADETVKSVIIEDGVTRIGQEAFRGFAALESVAMADSVTEIGYGAFMHCTALKTVTIPKNVTYISTNTFDGCYALTEINADENSVNFSGENGVLFNKDKTELLLYPQGKTDTEYVVPDGVQTIGYSAFSQSQLKNITLSDSVTSISDGGFRKCTSLESINLSNNLTYLGENAFSSCSALKSIVIPESLTRFGYWNFVDCTALESVTLPETLEEIGTGAFAGCTALKEINVPQTVNSIGNSAFYGCSGLEKITINNPDCVIYNEAIVSSAVIYGYKYSTAYDYAQMNGNEFVAIGETKELESISISSLPNKTSYKQGASFKQDGLAVTLHFADGTTMEKTQGFTVSGFDSENAGTCTLTVTYGGKTATFDVEITEYKELVIHAGETITVEIEAGSITYVKFEPTVSGTYTFYSSSDDDTYGYLFDADKNEIMKDDDGGNDTNFSITYDFEKGETYYFGAEYLESDQDGSFDVTLVCDEIDCAHANTTEHAQQDATCTENGYTAGVYCEDCQTWLSGHEVIRKHHTDEDGDKICDICGEKIKEIISSGNCGSRDEDGNFGDNVNWTLYEDGELVISGSGEMANFLFDYSSAPDAPYSEYVYDSYVDDDYNSNNIKSVIIEDGVTSIGNYAFYRCLSLEKIEISNSVQRIGKNALSGCALSELTIPGSVSVIDDSALSGLSKLTSLTLPEGVESVGRWVFSGCSGLIILNIPASLTSIGQYGLDGMKNITEINVSEDNEEYSSIDGVLFNKYKYKLIKYPQGKTDTEYTIPDGVKIIDDGAFECCRSLKNINIPDGVTQLGSYAFDGCDFTSIVLPESVRYIQGHAFSSCEQLTDIVIGKNVTNIGYAAFVGCDSLSDVYYTGSEEQWQNITIGEFNDCLLNATIHYNYVPTHTHQYVDTVTAPTCLTDGYTTHTCSVCGDTYTDTVVSALGHSFTNYVSNGDATCTQDGTKTAKCDRCDATDTVADTGSAKGHTPGKWITDKDSTCTETGAKHQVCSVCGETIATEEISVKEHQYTSVVTAPACMSDGYTTHTCSVCGDTYTDTIVPALGHSFTNYVSNGDATCTQDGTKTAKCDRCDVTDTVTDKGSKLPHTESEWIIDKAPDCVHNGSRHTVCTVCGQIAKTAEIPAVGHIFVEETVEPTCDQDGAVTNFCTVCSAKETVKVLPATGHTDKDGDGICEICGKDLTENCTCLCHKSGFAGFIYKIIRLFWKIFKINRKCVCGKIHY